MCTEIGSERTSEVGPSVVATTTRSATPKATDSHRAEPSKSSRNGPAIRHAAPSHSMMPCRRSGTGPDRSMPSLYPERTVRGHAGGDCRMESGASGIVCTMTNSTIEPAAAPANVVQVHNHGHVQLEDSMGSDLH